VTKKKFFYVFNFAIKLSFQVPNPDFDHPAMMYTVTLIPIPGMPYCPKPSDLLMIDQGTTRIKFVVSYVPYLTEGGFKFKALSRQIGEDGLKLPGGALIDFVIGDIFTGKTMDHVTALFQKLILVECGLWYKYQTHSGVNDDSIDIKKWISWFSDVSRIVPLNVSSLDAIIAKTVRIPIITPVIPCEQRVQVSLTQYDFSNKGKAVKTYPTSSEVLLTLPPSEVLLTLPPSEVERRIVQAPPIPFNDSSKKRKAGDEYPASSEVLLTLPPLATFINASDLDCADGLPFYNNAFADGWGV
jgi:hypothetical protein